MPHDARGRRIEPGDIVLMPFKVLAVWASEHDCNANLEPMLGMPPSGGKHGYSAVNTRQFFKVDDWAATLEHPAAIPPPALPPMNPEESIPIVLTPTLLSPSLIVPMPVLPAPLMLSTPPMAPSPPASPVMPTMPLGIVCDLRKGAIDASDLSGREDDLLSNPGCIGWREDGEV